MKKKLKLFLLTLTAITLTCCQNEDVITGNTPNNNSSLEYAKSVISELGFDAATLVDMGSYYLVEEDIAIPKENIVGYAGTSRLKQAHTNNVVTLSNVSNIKIQIESSLRNSYDWRIAIQNAMTQYNSIGSRIRMEEVTSNPDITIYYDNINAWGQGTPPVNGKPGSTLRIKNSTDANNLSLSQKTWLVAHELGHNLGMRHTDWILINEGQGLEGANHIPGTPTGESLKKEQTDSKSVFNSGYYYGGVVQNWNGFSDYDKVALRYLYPAPTPVLTLYIPPMSTYDIGRIYDQTAYCSLPGTLTYTWSSDQNRATIMSGQGTSSVRLKINSVPIQLTLRVTSSTGQSRDMDYYDYEGGDIKVY